MCFDLILHINLIALLDATNARPIIIRLIILGLVIAIGFWVYNGNRSNKTKIIVHSLKNDLLKPAVIFIGIIIFVEVMYKMYPNWNTDLPFNLFELFYYLINIVFLFLLLFINKTKFNTILSIFYVLFGIFFLFTFFPKANIFIIHHILYEFIPILLVFVIMSFIELHHLKTSENKDEFHFWQSYIWILANAKEITAFNTNDYNNFLDPLGFRYFAEQIKEISIRPYKNLSIRDDKDQEQKISNDCFTFKKRIFIIDKEINSESPEIIAITNHNKLADYQRNFKAVYLIHKSLGIKMYLVCRNDLKKYIEANWSFEWYQRYLIKKYIVSKLIVDMDKLLIGEEIFYPSEKKGSLSFEKSNNEKLNTLVKKAIENYGVENYNINKFLIEDYKI